MLSGDIPDVFVNVTMHKLFISLKEAKKGKKHFNAENKQHISHSITIQNDFIITLFHYGREPELSDYDGDSKAS